MAPPPTTRRLPREICVLLSEDDPAEMRAIADKADQLIAMHVPQGYDACATVSAVDEPEQDLVAATGSNRRRPAQEETTPYPASSAAAGGF